MNRRPQNFKDRRPQGNQEIREARGKAEAERRRTLERYKDHRTAVDRERSRARSGARRETGSIWPALNIADALAAARRLSCGPGGGRSPPGRAAEPADSRNAGIVLNVLRERTSVAVLQMAARIARYVA